jgi:hypothetical protein
MTAMLLDLLACVFFSIATGGRNEIAEVHLCGAVGFIPLFAIEALVAVTSIPATPSGVIDRGVLLAVLYF